MNCRRARHLLFDFFDGASNEALPAEVDRHLGECQECDKFASEMTSSLALLRRVPVEPVDENFNWKVRLAIHREKNAALERAVSANAWVRAWNVRYVLSTGFALTAVLLAGGMFVARNGTVPATVQMATQPAHEDKLVQESASPKPVPRSTLPTPMRNNFSNTVSLGGRGENFGPAPVGAIDEARIDSLINMEVMQLPEHERDEYIQRRINALRARQSQQPTLQH
ncbi:MAG TPA: zf-HC2 domain-containing protein [Candidatus Krumholzibacteria bacterium]|nr:zf-HC2 domain-containing protein [Candidatus Krumholzibacteria bacterium]